jgi:hypothetical protein
MLFAPRKAISKTANRYPRASRRAAAPHFERREFSKHNSGAEASREREGVSD